MSVIISWVFALFSGRFIFRRLYRKDKGHSVVRYYTVGAFCISYVLTFAMYVFPALVFGISIPTRSDASYEASVMASLSIFVFMALIFTLFGFGFGKLKEKFGEDRRRD